MLRALRRLPVKRPFSRKIRISPRDVFEPDSCPAPVKRFLAADSRDPLARALRFLFAVYRGEPHPEHHLPEDPADTAAITRLVTHDDLRKVFLACFREAVARGRIAAGQAQSLLEFERRFDPLYRDLTTDSRAPPPAARPLAFDYAKSVPARLRVALLFRTNFFGATSRNHDFGERLQSAFAASGIACALLPPDTAPGDVGPQDLVFVDEDGVFPKDAAKKRAQIEHLRKIARHLVRIAPDPWGAPFRQSLHEFGANYDFIWTMAPHLREQSDWRERPFCVVPFPLGYGRLFDEVAKTPIDSPISFCGSIEDYNIHRYVWLLFMLSQRLEVPITLTSHAYDGLPVEESLKIYLTRLLRSRAGLSLTMRATGERIVVQRALDVVRGQRLLIQEYAPEMSSYFTPGEHYVEFRTIAEMAGVVEALRGGRAYDEVQASGAEYFRRHYSDELIIRHLMTYL